MSKIISAFLSLNNPLAPSPATGLLYIANTGTETLTVTGIASFGFSFAQTAATIPAGQSTAIPFRTAAYVGGTRVVTIASDKTAGDAQPQCTIARTTDNVLVIPTEAASSEPTLQDYYNEVDALMRVDYPPARVDDILADKLNSEGAQAFTDYLAARATARTDAAAALGYYPISVSVAAGTVAAGGATKAITVTAAGDYTVTCPAGCTSDITDGTPSDTTVTITVEANTEIARTFAIVFTSGNMTPVTGTISQADGCAISADATASFVAAGEAKDVGLTANGAWTAALSGTNAAQFSIDPASGDETDTAIAVTALENLGTEKTATLTITRGTATDTCALTQAAAADAVTVTPATDTALAAGEVIDVAVSGISPVGTTCTAASDVEGVTLSKTTAIGNETITATIPENTGIERVITITVTRGTATDTCVITQAAGA